MSESIIYTCNNELQRVCGMAAIRLLSPAEIAAAIPADKREAVYEILREHGDIPVSQKIRDWRPE